MTMEFRASYGGPYVGKTDDHSPQNAVWKLVQRYRGTTRDKLEKMRNKLERVYIGQSREDPDLADSNSKYAFTNALTCILRKMEIEEGSTPDDYEDKRKDREAAAKEAKELAKKAAAEAKRSFILGFIMDHTFGELRQIYAANKNIGKIMKMGKPGQIVSQVLTRAAVAKILDGK